MVTVLIPARDEEHDIEGCLRAVLAQDHPHDRMEVVLVDGGSVDRTTEVAREVLGCGDIRWRLVDNPVGTTPSNLNVGLAVASGEILCRVDARSVIPPSYVRLCAQTLAHTPGVVVVGGAQVAVQTEPSVRAAGIARALNNRYAMGGSRYRSGARTGPADTVYLGAFRTADVRDAGGWDEQMLTNQDFELNRRLGRAGVVLFDGRLCVEYVPRRTLHDLMTQYHRFGRWKVRYWRRTEDSPQPRQILLLTAPLAAIIAGAAAVVSIRDHPKVIAAAVPPLFLMAWTVEARGCSGPEGSARARFMAIVAMGAIAGGWLAGVLREFFAESTAGEWSESAEYRAQNGL